MPSLIIIDFDFAIRQLLSSDNLSGTEESATDPIMLLEKLFYTLIKLREKNITIFFYSTDKIETVKEEIRKFAPTLASDINIVSIDVDETNSKQHKMIAIGKCVNDYLRYCSPNTELNTLNQIIVFENDPVCLESLSKLYKTCPVYYLFDSASKRLLAPYMIELRNIYSNIVDPEKKIRDQKIADINAVRDEEKKEKSANNEKLLLQPWFERIESDIESQLLHGMHDSIKLIATNISTILRLGHPEPINSCEATWLKTIDYNLDQALTAIVHSYNLNINWCEQINAIKQENPALEWNDILKFLMENHTELRSLKPTEYELELMCQQIQYYYHFSDFFFRRLSQKLFLLLDPDHQEFFFRSIETEVDRTKRCIPELIRAKLIPSTSIENRAKAYLQIFDQLPTESRKRAYSEFYSLLPEPIQKRHAINLFCSIDLAFHPKLLEILTPFSKQSMPTQSPVNLSSEILFELCTLLKEMVLTSVLDILRFAKFAEKPSTVLRINNKYQMVCVKQLPALKIWSVKEHRLASDYFNKMIEQIFSTIMPLSTLFRENQFSFDSLLGHLSRQSSISDEKMFAKINALGQAQDELNEMLKQSEESITSIIESLTENNMRESFSTLDRSPSTLLACSVSTQSAPATLTVFDYCAHGRTQDVLLALQQPGFNINSPTNTFPQHSLLEIALRHGHASLAYNLAVHGAKNVLPNNKHLIFIALYSLSCWPIRHLLLNAILLETESRKSQISFTTVDENNNTPLHIATSLCSENAVVQLLDFAMNPNTINVYHKNYRGNTALLEAFLHDFHGTHYSIIKLFFTKGIFLNKDELLKLRTTKNEYLFKIYEKMIDDLFKYTPGSSSPRPRRETFSLSRSSSQLFSASNNRNSSDPTQLTESGSSSPKTRTSIKSFTSFFTSIGKSPSRIDYTHFPFHDCIMNKTPGDLERLLTAQLQSNQFDFLKRDSEGYTALQKAILTGRIEFAQTFYNCGVGLSQTDIMTLRHLNDTTINTTLDTLSELLKQRLLNTADPKPSTPRPTIMSASSLALPTI